MGGEEKDTGDQNAEGRGIGAGGRGQSRGPWGSEWRRHGERGGRGL